MMLRQLGAEPEPLRGSGIFETRSFKAVALTSPLWIAMLLVALRLLNSEFRQVIDFIVASPLR
jgi:hypothetical protein